MLITDAPERTWRPPLAARMALALCMGVIITLPAGYLALTLWTNQVSHAIWIALALALAAWGFLAGRALAQSVTLTSDTLVVRNIFTTERVPLAAVTDVSFRRGKLRVTSQHGTFAAERFVVGAVNLGMSHRASPDVTAAAITDAAGLPPLPPRPQIISRPVRPALLAVIVFGFGLCLGPVRGLHTPRSRVLAESGAMLLVAVAVALSSIIRRTRDRHRNRATALAPTAGATHGDASS